MAANEAPVLNLNGAAIAYTENGASAAIAPAATVVDPDSPDFATGTLTVSFNANGSDGDQLTILNTGNGTGAIGVSGNVVRYQGVEIGTFTGGTDGFTPLVVTLAAAATPAAVQALMRAIAYSNASDNPGTATRTIGFVLTDGDGGTSAAVTANATVEAVNDTPVNTVPVSVVVGEGREVSISGVSISDPDLDGGPISVTLTVEHGTLSIFEDYIGFQITNNNSSSVTITSLDWAINLTFDDLKGIVYTPDPGYSGPDSLTITTNDGGLSGTDPGGDPASEQDVDVVPITVVPANQAPVVDAGDPVSGQQGEFIALTGVSVSDADVDPATGKLTIHLSVEHGTLTIRTDVAGGISASGILSASSSDGSSASGASITITGTPDQINATLAAVNGLGYHSADHFTGSDVLNMSVHEGSPADGIAFSSLGSAYFPAPKSILLADLDGDGADDLIIGYGEGDGVIEVSGPGFAAFAADGTPTALAVGDFDGDGVKDIAYAAYATDGSGSIGFVAGGSGDTVTIARVSDAIDLIVGDLNGDGLADITALRGNGEIAIILRDGAASFAAPVFVASAGGTPVSLASGDFNGDGELDLLVARAGSIDILRGQGDGSFAAAVRVVESTSVIAGSALADFNGDGLLDFAFITDDTNGDPAAVNGVHIALGDGAGGFGPSTLYASAADARLRDILAADINGDGIVDLVLASMGASGAISVLRGNGDGTFQAAVDIATNADPHLLAIGDPDGDGDPDLLAGSLDDLIEAFNNDIDRVGSEATRPITIVPAMVFNGGSGDDVVYGGPGSDSLSGNGGADRLMGNAGNDRLFGGNGNDGLEGGTGNDIMDGGAGDDIVYVDSPNDVVIEAVGGGNDRVFASASFRLQAGVEIELLAARNQLGTIPLNLSGNEFAQAIIGNDGANGLDGGGGNDTIHGLGGDDVLDGGTGNDMLIGGAGNDSYVVDSANDLVVEQAGQGNDRVLASASYVLRAGNEVELLSAANQNGTTALNLTGNEFAQAIIGNEGINTLNGGGGNDTIYGLGGDDVLSGGTGNDMLIGGTGNDVYSVDSASDLVIELAGEGNDRVLASASYALRAGNEIELLSAANQLGTVALNLSGNEFAQAIIGNEGANSLDGGGGNDTLYGRGGDDVLSGGAGNDMMIGGAGNDVYSVDSANDLVVEQAGQGNDRVLASASYVLRAGNEIELLSAADQNGTVALNLSGNEFAQAVIGNAGANILDGGGGNDTLYGLDGNDVLNGGTGNDRLIGGAGNDKFQFSTALGASNVDTIADWGAGDQIWLKGSIFGGMSAGTLSPDAFRIGTAAQDADDRLIYDQASGRLYYDADGSGAGEAVLFALLGAGTMLNAGDFTIY